ncbi:MAG: hypothetical protein Q9180_002709, partial [Flavoplaca navasiana]
MWGTWFGGNSAQRRKDAPKKAILDLRQQLDMLQKRERHLENQMANEDKKAKENVTSNKTGVKAGVRAGRKQYTRVKSKVMAGHYYEKEHAARAALKRKKQHEHSLEQTSGQISMLEQQIYSIESANINQETLAAMKNAGAAMKTIHGKMTMEDVDVT